MKGFVQIDYVVAFGFFFIVVVFLTQNVTTYVSSVRGDSDILLARSEAVDLLTSADFPAQPLNWSSEEELRRIGFSTTAYSMLVVVNNTQPFLRNQSASPSAMTSELVTLNYSETGFRGIDINSTVVYDENNNSIAYQINGTNITFAIPVNASQVRYLTIYFDDDSNFTSRSQAVSGNDNLTERVFFPESLELMQFRQLQKLMNANYSQVRNSTMTSKDFTIKLLDIDTSVNFLSFGPDLPRKGNIVALQRYGLYQNSSGFVRKGRLTVQVG
ncbi:MAG: hypothetical protein HYT73_04900 [Candidatus Aenigmarchaeota archaeon]|nr:hypothetical protein [Candidatus Aenigmarchaeota archaeon]